MQNILDKIVLSKQLEINQLYQDYNIDELRTQAQATSHSFYANLARAREAQQPFFICEFKRKSPSEGWIDEHADLPKQINGYAQAGAGAISVLTDGPFFGGSYDDLRLAAATLASAGPNRPLLLQKDFILDEIQLYLARAAGADMILLIAAILDADRLQALREVAESLGMGALVEVHDQEELDKIKHLDFPVLGINNRDLKVFRTSLNRVNVLSQQANGRFVISESGIHNYRDFAVVRHADGFLIGTGLMRQGAESLKKLNEKRLLFKACGIRSADINAFAAADFLGINFSPVSKRRMPLDILDQIKPLPANAVAVFYQNSEAEILETLEKYPFQRIQLYAGDVTPEFVRRIKQKILLAVRVRTKADLEIGETYASDIDLFILDGAAPGSGTLIPDAVIPADFPYPFLLAGGIHADNLHLTQAFQHCIGVDMASGIETDGAVDPAKITLIAEQLKQG